MFEDVEHVVVVVRIIEDIIIIDVAIVVGENGLVGTQDQEHFVQLDIERV